MVNIPERSNAQHLSGLTRAFQAFLRFAILVLPAFQDLILYTPKGITAELVRDAPLMFFGTFLLDFLYVQLGIYQRIRPYEW